jgi:hypothetical protein
LQKEMESIRPVDYDDLMTAADLLQNFSTYWEKSENMDNVDDVRQQLIAKIVDRVFVYDDKIIAIALHGSFGVVLDDEMSVPYEVIDGISRELKSASTKKIACTQNGSDGHRTLLSIKLYLLSHPSSRNGNQYLRYSHNFNIRQLLN